MIQRLALGLALGLALVLWCVAALALLAETAAAQKERTVEELDPGVGEPSLVEGKYRQALAEYRAALKKDPESRGDRWGLALTLFETGAYDEAATLLEVLVKQFPAVPAYRLKLGEIRFLRGRLEDAEKAWRGVLQDHPEHFEAHARLGRFFQWQGQRDRAREHFAVPEGAASKRVIKTYEELLYLGWCYQGLDRLKDAVEVLGEALSSEDHGNVELYPAYHALIAIYLEGNHVYGSNPHYMSAREEAFRNNPHHPDIHLLMADVYLARMEHHQAREELEKALAVNPNLLHGLCLAAYFAMDRMDFQKAAEHLEKALKINPVDKEALAYRAALHDLKGEREAAEAGWRRVLEIDAGYGEAFRIASELLGNLRRYEEAYAMAKRAVQTEPTLWRAWDLVARYALHLGREKEALEALERARKGDPYSDRYPWRTNLLELFRHLDEFVVHKFGPFHLRLHVEDNPVLRRYVQQALEDALKSLGPKYGFQPRGPIRVEIFNKQSDFAVRTVGVPGIYGVLGACFGQVITMNSPRALPPGSYVWASTLWHEFAHVITLQMSRYRVSRWLTEGLSVYEEKCKNPAWEDVQDERLFNAVENGRVVPIQELDGLFRSPRIAFAYLQSLHAVEFIIARKGGFEKILKMLNTYAEGRSTPEVIQTVFGIEPAAFDREFLAYLRERFAGQHIQRVYSQEAYQTARDTLELDPQDVDALRVLAWYYFQKGPEHRVDCEAALGKLLARKPQEPSGLALRGRLALRARRVEKAREYLEKARQLGHDEFYSRLNLARISASEAKIPEAVEHYLAAKKLFPRYVGPGNPYVELAKIYREQGDQAAARREVEALVKLLATDVEGRLELARHHLEGGQHEQALTYLQEANQVSPFDPVLHHLMARAHAAGARYPVALEEIDLAILLIEESDPRGPLRKTLLPDLRLERACILRKMGRLDEAKAEAEAARKKHPDHAGLKAFPNEGTGN